MSRLITPTLVGNIKWLHDCPDNWKESAKDDLHKLLAREYSDPPNKDIERGIKFEQAVEKAAYRLDPIGSKLFQTVVDECRNGIFQVKTRKYFELDNETICLYGKIDVKFPDILKDIKTTRNYRGKEHYLNSFQHKTYCYNEQRTNFRYVVAVFEEETETIKEVHLIDYRVESFEELEKEVYNTVRSTLDFLRADKELWKLYTTKFSIY